jgi:ATP-dependent Clp protease ATP-binding subunit ClpA
VFERFTDPARNAVVVAQEIARGLDHDYIGTEHVVAALPGDEQSPASAVLTSYGLTREVLVEEIVVVVGRGPGTPAGHVPFTPDAKKLLELSLREALQLGDEHIGTEHVLLGLTRLPHCTGAELLTRRGIDLDTVRRDLLAITSSEPAPRRQRRGWRARLREPLVGRPLGPSLDRCSFCGRQQPAVEVLLSGEGDARICDRCVAAAAKLVDDVRAGGDEPPEEPPAAGPRLAEPG